MREENKERKPQGEEPCSPVPSIALAKGGGVVKGIGETFKLNPFTLTFMAKSLSSVPPPRIFVPPALAKSVSFYLHFGSVFKAVSRRVKTGLNQKKMINQFEFWYHKPRLKKQQKLAGSLLPKPPGLS